MKPVRIITLDDRLQNLYVDPEVLCRTILLNSEKVDEYKDINSLLSVAIERSLVEEQERIVPKYFDISIVLDKKITPEEEEYNEESRNLARLRHKWYGKIISKMYEYLDVISYTLAQRIK